MYLVNYLRYFNKLIIFVFILFSLTAVSLVSAQPLIGQAEGYVKYEISITGISEYFQLSDFIVTESIKPTDKADFMNVELSLSSPTTNFTYSKVMNSSTLPIIFPYLPELTNQSFSFQREGFSISASIVNTGQSQVNFNDNTYQAIKYLIDISATNSSKGINAQGEILTMPSGLIYKAKISLDSQSSVELTLLSTDLDLEKPQNGIDPVGASLLGGGSVLAIAIAAPTIFRKIKNRKSSQKTKTSQKKDENNDKEDENKPSYWVD